MNKLLKRILPKKLRRKIRLWLLRLFTEEATIAEGWELYAQDHNGKVKLGDEWNEPERIGLNVPASEIVPHLDRIVFEPFSVNATLFWR